jgi:hypothetical protein
LFTGPVQDYEPLDNHTVGAYTERSTAHTGPDIPRNERQEHLTAACDPPTGRGRWRGGGGDDGGVEPVHRRA